MQGLDDDKAAFSPGAEQAGRRALRLACLGLLTRRDGGKLAALRPICRGQHDRKIGALSALLDVPRQGSWRIRRRWRQQSQCHGQVVYATGRLCRTGPNDAGLIAPSLLEHPGFDWKNPNRFRTVIGALSANHAGFHHRSGAGYGWSPTGF
jgi:aminopeptidase N